MESKAGDSLNILSIIARKIREGEYRRQTRKVKKSAFLPRLNGNDDDGLSVSEVDDRTQYTAESFLGCFLQVGKVKSIGEPGEVLDVVYDPLPENLHHALIVGIPLRSDSSKSVAIDNIARALAELASMNLDDA